MIRSPHYCRRARLFSLLLLSVPFISPDARAQAELPDTTSFASPLRTAAPDALAFNGSALRLEIDHQLVGAIRDRRVLMIRDFPLAPAAAGQPPRSVALQLRALNIFGPETKFVIGDRTAVDGRGDEVQLPLPTVAIFEGAIAGEPDSEVFLSFSEHGTYGFVRSGDSEQIISSGPVNQAAAANGAIFIYDPRALPEGTIHWRDFVCQTVAPHPVPLPAAAPEGGTPPCREVLLAIETDYEFTDDLFNGNLYAASNYVAVMTAAASNRYKIAVNTRIRLGYVRLWNSSADPWTMNGAGPQLEQFQQVWEATMESVPRNLAHFLSGRDLGGGVAWLDTVCNPWWGYGLSANLDGSFPFPMVNNNAQNWDIYVFCHELGHNFGSIHTHEFCPPADRCASQAAWGPCQNSTICVNTGTIMSYCHTCSGGVTNIVLSFHEASKLAMLAHLDSVSQEWCVLDCPPPQMILVPQNYPTIQAAINASEDGDHVLLADGTYTGTGNKNLDFYGRLITVRSASGNPEACIIDCQGNGKAFHFHHQETLDATVSGLTIKNAYPASAISTHFASVTVTNCIFTNNQAAVDGGGAIRIYFGSTNISNCSFIDNMVFDPGGLGGALSLQSVTGATITDCMFQDNFASVAGAIHGFSGSIPLEITGCAFHTNSAGSGGAIYSSTPLRLTDCTFAGNFNLNTNGPGGAVYLSGDNAVITNCGFFGNKAGTSGGKGGAIRVLNGTPHIINCVFSGNKAGNNSGGWGGAISTEASNPRIVNCTIYGNTANAGGGVHATNGSPRITNDILWANTPQQVLHGGNGGGFQITYTNIQGGANGVGNLNVNPLFVDADGPDNVVGTIDDDLRIAGNSPVIDMGTNVPHHYQRMAAQWLNLRPAAETYAFDQFYPGIAATGCLSGIEPATLALGGGTVVVSALDSSNNVLCSIVDGSTGPAVSDGNLVAPATKLRLEFDPPVTAFQSFYGSLASGTTGTMKLFSGGAQIGQFTSAASPDNVLASGHGFSALVPIDEIEVTVTDTATNLGAFVGLASGDSSLGTINIPGYSGPQGSNVLKDFGVVFGDADLPGDLDGNPRVTDGNDDTLATVDMGAYEFQPMLIPCPADIDDDGQVAVADLLSVINNWGAGTGNAADVTGDGTVNVQDLLAVIGAWGTCP